jgi:hypothetical protein
MHFAPAHGSRQGRQGIRIFVAGIVDCEMAWDSPLSGVYSFLFEDDKAVSRLQAPSPALRRAVSSVMRMGSFYAPNGQNARGRAGGGGRQQPVDSGWQMGNDAYNLFMSAI